MSFMLVRWCHSWFPAAQVMWIFQIWLQWLFHSSQVAPCTVGARWHRFILSVWMPEETSNHPGGNKTTHLSWAARAFLPVRRWMTTLVLSVCVCVFVYRSGAKWPGTGGNRKRARPPTNERRYSNGVFVVRRSPHAAVAGSIVWGTASACQCSVRLSLIETHLGQLKHTLTDASSHFAYFTVRTPSFWWSYCMTAII